MAQPIRTDACGEGADQVFLSPRVIDERAFTDLADRLRALIDQASSAARQAKRTGAQSESLRAGLEQAATRLTTCLEKAGGVLSAIDERAKGAEDLYARVAERSSSIEELEKQAEAVIEAKVGALEKSMDGALKAVDQRVKQIRTRLDQVAKKADARASELERRLRTSVDERSDRAEQTAARLEGVLDRAESELPDLDARKAELEQAIEGACRTALERAEQEAAALADRAAEAVGGAQARLDKSVATTEAYVASARKEVDEYLGPRLESLAAAGERAAALLGWKSPADAATTAPAPNSLGDLMRRVEESTRAASLAQDRLDEIRRQSDEARATLGESLVQSAERIDQMIERREELEAGVRTATASAESIEEALRSRIAEAEAAMAAPLEQIRSQADEAEARAAEAARTAEEARRRLAEAAKWNQSVLLRLEDAASRLEPWRDLLLGEEAPDELPSPLRTIVDRARDEIAAPLVELGSVIQTIGRHAHGAEIAEAKPTPARPATPDRSAG